MRVIFRGMNGEGCAHLPSGRVINPGDEFNDSDLTSDTFAAWISAGIAEFGPAESASEESSPEPAKPAPKKSKKG